MKKLFTSELRQHRLAAGLTQREVAERCGVSRENYARIERGAASTTIETLTRIVNALGLVVTFTPKG